MTDWHVVPAASLVATPWRNGRGISREIAGAVSGGLLEWQMSIADLVEDAPFSHYPGVERIFTPITGDPPPELAFDGGPFERCPLLQPKTFSGERTTIARIGAPGRAFNVIANRRDWQAEVRVLRLRTGAPIVVPKASHVLLHCLSGTVAAGAARLEAGDSALGSGLNDTMARPEIVEPGLLILVGLSPRVLLDGPVRGLSRH